MSLEQGELEVRSRALFRDSVEGMDMATRSRLTQARHAALAAAERRGPRAWLSRISLWTPAAGVTAAALLAAVLWFGIPLGQHAVVTADSQSNFEDLELVASSDESSGDAMEMLQEDIDFYAWADKAASAEPEA